MKFIEKIYWTLYSLNSYALFNRSAADILAEAYSLPSIEEGELLKGFVSRKKQIVPTILEILEKK